MSLAIDANRVTAVLLTNGDWMGVAPQSFWLDSYEYVDGEDNDDTLHAGGRSGVCATGFVFAPADAADDRIKGPLTAIVAVRHQ